MLRIAIRADASTSIGFGHIKRCLALAYALRERGAYVCVVARYLGVDTAALIAADGFTFTELGSPDGVPVVAYVPNAEWTWKVDASQAINALSEMDVDWIIVDHYALDARWHRAVASALSCRVAVIDDLADRALAANILIDHNLAADHALKYAGRIDENAILLGGPRFALLGPSFATAERYDFHESVRSIGIFMGGTDAGNFSSIVLKACRSQGFVGPIEIVTTRSNPNLSALRAAVADDSRASITIDLRELSTFFARHDLQIGAGGGATWERCCIGSPTLALSVADNQRQVLLPLAQEEAVIVVDSTRPTVEDVAHALAVMIDNPGLRRRMSVRAMDLVDGLGARRVAGRVVGA